MNYFALVALFVCLALILKVETVDGIKCYECSGPTCDINSFNEETAKQVQCRDGKACYFALNLVAPINITEPRTLLGIKGKIMFYDHKVANPRDFWKKSSTIASIQGEAQRGCRPPTDDECGIIDGYILCTCTSDLCNMATHGITSVFIVAALVIIAAICKYE